RRAGEPHHLGLDPKLLEQLRHLLQLARPAIAQPPQPPDVLHPAHRGGRRSLHAAPGELLRAGKRVVLGELRVGEQPVDLGDLHRSSPPPTPSAPSAASTKLPSGARTSVAAAPGAPT